MPAPNLEIRYWESFPINYKRRLKHTQRFLIRDKRERELQNRETLPWALENRKLFPNAIFGNNVKYSPLGDRIHRRRF